MRRRHPRERTHQALLLNPELLTPPAGAQQILAPIGPMYALAPVPNLRELRRITQDYIFLVDYEPAQKADDARPRLLRITFHWKKSQILHFF